MGLLPAASSVGAPTCLTVVEDYSVLEGFWLFLLQSPPHLSNIVICATITVLKSPAILQATWQLLMQVDIMDDTGLLLVEAQYGVALLWAKVEMLVLPVAPPLMILIESLDVQLPVFPDFEWLGSVWDFLAGLSCNDSECLRLAFDSTRLRSAMATFCGVVYEVCPLSSTSWSF